MRICLIAFVALVATAGCSCSTGLPGSSPDPRVAMESPGDTLLRSIWMEPEPWSTRIATNARLTFTIDIEKNVLNQDIAAGFALATFAGEPVPFTSEFGEKAIGAPIPETLIVRTLTITPTRGFAANTDYTVTVRQTGTFRPFTAFVAGSAGYPRVDGAFVTAMGTGNHPRLSSLQVNSKDGGKTLTSLRLQFSEPVLQSTVLKGLRSSTILGEIDGFFVEPHPIYQDRVQEVRTFEYRFMQPVASKVALAIRLSDVRTQGGVPLESWPGDRSGVVRMVPSGFEIAADTAKLATVAGGWLWTPSR